MKTKTIIHYYLTLSLVAGTAGVIVSAFLPASISFTACICVGGLIGAFWDNIYGVLFKTTKEEKDNEG